MAHFDRSTEAVFEEISNQKPELSRDWIWGAMAQRGTPYLYWNGFPKGKTKLISMEDPKAISVISKETQRLSSPPNPKALSFRMRTFSGLKSENLEMLQKEPLLEINPDDAGNLYYLKTER